MNQTNYKLRDILQNNFQDSSENVNIVQDKDWDSYRLKEPKETWQVNEMHGPWLDSGLF